MLGICLATALILANANMRPENRSLVVYEAVLTGASICSSATALAKNFAVSLSTDTPTKGENVTTTFDFDLDTPVVDGTASYSATLNGFGPYTSHADLCAEVAKSGDSCPLATGHHHQVSTAASTVSGKVVTTITWHDAAGAEILCTQITTKTI